ncbi:hypothetical protein [Nesterenkonia alkaliphila]|uniref:Uncharacterized protein n=1 Tax=Nesterenkonia alkaliphila TaxID=1463631 RepID=A0A7K1UKK8_9MICC|nr:hypothetical protein [Nesterenkonia alkaliphila]MVT27025.1 hypothetical protein [Nesterenkonia alkaliphila]
MPRSYTRKTARAEADRAFDLRYEHRDQPDAEKIAEVLIRLALRTSHEEPAGQAGQRLRELLTSSR